MSGLEPDSGRVTVSGSSGRAQFLPHDIWKEVVRNAPLVSIDLLVQNERGEYLLGKRVNKPAKGFWFTAGGVVRKGERLDDAFRRLTLAELGIEIERSSAQFHGVYEHHYDDNFSGEEFGTHYVVLAYRLNLAQLMDFPKQQHHEYGWMSAEQLIGHPHVHRYVKDYFAV